MLIHVFKPATVQEMVANSSTPETEIRASNTRIQHVEQKEQRLSFQKKKRRKKQQGKEKQRRIRWRTDVIRVE